MSAGIRQTFLSGGVAALILSLALPLLADEAEEKQAQLEQLRENIGELREEIERTQGLHDNVLAELRDLERRISQSHKRLKSLAGQLREQRQALAKLEARQGRLRKTLKKQEHLLGRQIRAAYIIGKQEYMKLLLNQEDPSAMGRVMRYYDYFHQARSGQIAEARATLQELAKVGRKIEQRTQTLSELHDKQQAQMQELEQASQARSIVLAKLRKQLNNKTENLEQMLEDEKRLQRLVQALENAIPEGLLAGAEQRPFAEQKGRLPWPTDGNLRALFGKSRHSGRLKWNGVIIKASEGKDVHAISHGRVAYADWLRGYGLLLIIDHGDGYMSLYGHNQVLYKETGEWVEPGDIIASVGSSGGQSYSGLYFEIRQNGKPSNPTRWCRSRS